MPFIFYAQSKNALSVEKRATEKCRCAMWYNAISSEEANQMVCTAKGVTGMEKRNCIGVKRKAGDSGKCNGERLHSLKYNGRKLLCFDCFKYHCAQLRLREPKVRLL